MFPATPWGWAPQVHTTSALTGDGLETVWKMICDYEAKLKENGWWQRKRTEQLKNWMTESIHDRLLQDFYHAPQVEAALPQAEQEVLAGRLSPFVAAAQMLKLFRLSV
jgi:LAO/AO transport system kinase